MYSMLKRHGNGRWRYNLQGSYNMALKFALPPVYVLSFKKAKTYKQECRVEHFATSFTRNCKTITRASCWC